MRDTVKEHNYSVDIIRFGLIAWIVLHHYTCVYNVIDGVEPIYFPLRFNQGGHVGNACFFVLAGYFMGRNFFKGSFSSIKEFILYCVRRYLRFYPTYALAVVFIAIWLFGFPLPERETDILKFVVNFLFIVHPSGFVDGAHWFIAILLLCQCITVILKFTPPHIRRFSIYILLCILSPFVVRPYDAPTYLDKFFSGEFYVLTGILIYDYKSSRNKKLLAALLIISIWMLYGLRDNLFAFGCSYATIAYVILTGGPVLPKPLLPLFKYLGTISFPWYLVHQFIGYSILLYLCPSGNLSMLWLTLPVSITLLLAVMINYLSSQIKIKV